MSQENIALVRQSFDAWNEGGPQSAKQFWAEWHDFPGLHDRRVLRGRDAVVAHLTDQLSLLGELKTTIVEVRVLGETVVLRTELTIHGAKSGIDVPGEVAQVWEVADGRVQRVRLFLT
jgi:ketosteroid isomerase-like protein